MLALIGTIAAVVAVVVALIALYPQFRGTSRKIKLVSSYAMPVYDGPTGPDFRDDDQIEIEVFNQGGVPITITNYGINIGAGSNIQQQRPVPWQTRLPTTLQPGGSPAKLYIPVQGIRDVAAERGVSFKRMKPWVSLGDGRRIRSRKGLPLA